MVCGCSFSAVSTKEEYNGTAWSEILVDKLGWNLQNIARQGCSNGGIRIQIDEVLRQKPDFAIITPTSYDRIEIPNFIKEKTKLDFSKLTHILMDMLLRPVIYDTFKKDDGKSYYKDAGLDNINYGNNYSRLIVETIHSLADNHHHPYRLNQPVLPEVQTALEMYINYIYDGSWKRQMDEWIIRDGLVQLQANNIPFLINTGYSLWPHINYMKEALTNVIDEIYILDDDKKNPYSVFCIMPPPGSTPKDPYGPNDPGYHTSIEGQQFIADGFYNIIKNRWGL